MEQTDSTTFVWEIENFKSKTQAENSTNGVTRFIKNKNCMFYLTINYSFQGDSPNQIAIFLRNKTSNSAINVLFKISLINENGDECFVNESSTSFISKKSYYPSKGGLYLLDRDYILDEANRLLPGGKLTVKCELTLLNNENVGSLAKLSVSDKSIQVVQKKALGNYQALLESGKYSDVVFVVGKKEFTIFTLHKNILTSQSPVFKAMFDCDFEEHKPSRVDIFDIQVEVFEQLIRFIYTTNLDSIDKYDLDLFVAADMYQLDSLKDICAQSLGSKLNIYSVVNTLLLADMYNSSDLKSKCIRFVTKNSKKVIETEYWKKMIKNPKNFKLIKELYHDMAVSK